MDLRIGHSPMGTVIIETSPTRLRLVRRLLRGEELIARCPPAGGIAVHIIVGHVGESERERSHGHKGCWLIKGLNGPARSNGRYN